MSTTLHSAEGYFSVRVLRGLTEEQAIEINLAKKQRILFLSVVARAIEMPRWIPGVSDTPRSTGGSDETDYPLICELAGLDASYLRKLLKRRLETKKATLHGGLRSGLPATTLEILPMESERENWQECQPTDVAIVSESGSPGCEAAGLHMSGCTFCFHRL
jgi:hypothetical protein